MHTPGPWKANEYGNLITAKGEFGLHIAYVATVGMGKVGPANAKLIAAAPLLLEALKRYVEWQEGKFDAIDIEAEILAPAKAAIAAAEGR